MEQRQRMPLLKGERSPCPHTPRWLVCTVYSSARTLQGTSSIRQQREIEKETRGLARAALGGEFR
jgi:hypothetical protein